jgi:hypothetical protein
VNSLKSDLSNATIFNVYLGAACLPLNVVENQTRARSSVPAKQGWGNGARH